MSKTSNTSDSSRDLVPTSSSKLGPPRARNAPRKSGQSHPAISVRFVLNALRQWWKVAAPIGLVLAAVSAVLVYVSFQPVYEASTWIQIDEKPPFIAYEERGGSRRFAESQRAVICTPLVLAPVLAREIEPKNGKWVLAPLPSLKILEEEQEKETISQQKTIATLPEIKEQLDPINWLAKRINVNEVGPELLQISFRNSDPANAALIVNAITDAYFNLRDQRDDVQRQRVLELLDVEKERRKQEVERLRDQVRQLTKQATGTDPYAASSPADKVLNHPLADLQNRLTAAEVEALYLSAQITAFEEAVGKQKIQVPEAMVNSGIDQHPEVVGLRGLIMGKEAKLNDFKRVAAEKKQSEYCDPLAKEIKEDEEALAEVREKLRDVVAAGMKATLIAQRKDALADMKVRRDSYDGLKKVLETKLKAERQKIIVGTGETLELKFAEDELARAQDVHDLIASRATKLRTEQNAPQRVKLRQQAETPRTALADPYKKMVLFSLAAFCLPFALAVFWERIVRRVSSSQELEQQSNLTVVGEIARLPVRTSVAAGSMSGRTGRGLRVFEESIDGLRTCLMLSEPLNDVKVLAVTSAANQEGKTSVAAQLAVSIARASGEPTLLIDGDMRSPDVHRVFQIPQEPGLAEVLGGECPLGDAIVTSWSKHVHLLPAGTLRTSPHKLLGNGAVKSVLDEVRPSYRYIIIDTPPVLSASEALVLAKAADASLLCAMRDISRVAQVRTAYERLVTAGARPVGTVLNGVPTHQYAYRYGTYAYSRD